MALYKIARGELTWSTGYPERPCRYVVADRATNLVVSAHRLEHRAGEWFDRACRHGAGGSNTLYEVTD